jgi:type I restriction enzyme S subunit
VEAMNHASAPGWEAIKLGRLGRFLKGSGVRKDQAASGEIGCIRYGEIYTHHHNIVRTLNSHISAAVASTSTRLVKGDILFAASGETKEEIGKAVAFVHDSEVYAGGDIIIFRPTACSSEFLGYYLNSSKVAKQKASNGQGDAVVHIRTAVLSELELEIPPLSEQRAIAAALSDVDALLDSLDRLIAKKRDVKLAVTQQLLTGKMRLPGFKGEWEVQCLGDFGFTYGGLTGKTKSDFGVGNGQFITFMNVMSNVVIDSQAFDRVKISPTESQNKVQRGDLLFNGSSETPEEVAYCSMNASDLQNLFLNSFCFGFRFNAGAEADALFLAYYFRSREGREVTKSLAQGSTRYNVSKLSLLKAPIRLPGLEEQRAIVEVLADIDLELDDLSARHAKTLLLKLGMMQELLSGRTRLVPTEANHA